MVIDQYDIDCLKEWLRIAKKEGTEALRIVAGPQPNTYIVKLGPPRKDEP